MSYSYDQQMSEIHALLAWCALALFLVRGLAYQLGADWAEDRRLRVLVFAVAVLLAVTGLSLWVVRYHNPLRDGWLLAKLLAWVAYLECGHWAVMGRGTARLFAYLGALLLLAYMMGVSITRSPWLGLV